MCGAVGHTLLHKQVNVTQITSVLSSNRSQSTSAMSEHVCSSISESGRVFTWGRGDYGQLGRQRSISQKPEQQSAGPLAEGEIREFNLPTEVKLLRGATQVIYLSVSIYHCLHSLHTALPRQK